LRNILKFPNEKSPRVFVYTIALRASGESERVVVVVVMKETEEDEAPLLLRVAAGLSLSPPTGH
jgi:hypothetical protein